MQITKPGHEPTLERTNPMFSPMTNPKHRNLYYFAKSHDWFSHHDDKGVIVEDHFHIEGKGWDMKLRRFRTMKALRAWAGY
jgi:hypothetical protein